MRGERNKLLKVLLLLMTIALMSFLNLQAQETQDSFAFSIDIDDVIITGQSVPTDSKNAIYKVQSISQRDIEVKGQTQLQEVLASLPNVRIITDPILGTSIKMRGAGSGNVNVMIDGVPVIGRLNGALDLSQININDIKKIEVIEGPVSTLYGNNASGGVVNIITKKSIKKKHRLYLSSQYESIGIQTHNLNLAMQKHGFFLSASSGYLKNQLYALDSTRVYTPVIDQDGNVLTDQNGNDILQEKYPWNPKELWTGNISARIPLKETGFILYKYGYSQDDIIDLGKINRIQFMPYAFDRNYITKRNDHSLSFHQEWHEYYLDAIAAKNYYKRFFTTERFNFDENAIDPSLTTIDTSFVEALFLKVTLASAFKGPLNFLAGINYNDEEGFGDRLGNGGSDQEWVTIDDLAFFGSVNYQLKESLTISGSSRFLRNSVFGNYLTPALQLKWNLNNAWTIRGGYANGFRAPSLKELHLNFVDANHFIQGNENLIPEKSQDFSLNGTFTETADDKFLQFSIGAYYNDIDEKIQLVEYEQLKFAYQNISAFKAYGLNASAGYGTNQWKYSTAISFGYWQSGNGVDPNAVFDMQHGLEYHWPKGINTNLQYRFVGADPQFTQDINGLVEERSIDPYHLLDIHGNRKFWKDKILFGVGIKNLLNTQSVGVTGITTSGSANPHNGGSTAQLVNQGRRFYVKVSLEF